ncbi:MAG: hypothetical protein IID39_09185, partial [Planctomycetes bacterium]|nr:hypothetical protein [Planctomycetota bacterium]
MLALLKRNLFFILCAVVAVASIGLGAVGLSSMSTVREEMKSISGVYTKFNSALRGAVNAESIAAKRREIEAIQTNYKAATEQAHALNRYQPLTTASGQALFPDPEEDAKYEFGTVYQARFGAMLERLKAGTPPSRQ